MVRPGAEYGIDYVLYDRHPSVAHSSYCVLALTGSKRPEVLRWTDIEAASRVCADVRAYPFTLCLREPASCLATAACHQQLYQLGFEPHAL